MEKMLNLIRHIKEEIEEVESHFIGRCEAAGLLNTAAFSNYDFDIDTNSYILHDGDADALMDYILQMGEVKTAERKEVVILPNLKEGSITKRKDGRWQGRYYDNGVRRYLYATTKKDIILAVNKAVDERNKRDTNKIATKNVRLGKWITQWLELYKEPNVTESTLIIYKRILKNLYDHSISKKPVCNITSADIERFLATIKARKVREMLFGLLKTSFKDLEKNRVINHNVFNYINNISISHAKDKNVPTMQELSSFLSQLKEDNIDLYYFARFISLTGMRKGEALALTWDDIRNDKIYINKSYNLLTETISTTKSKTSTRQIPLFPKVVELLEHLPKDKVIFHKIANKSVSSLFNYYAKKFNYKSLTLHSMRHYFATQCLEAGIEHKIVQKWLGHSKYEVTANLYSHVKTEFENTEIVKMAKYWDDNE